MEKLKLNWVSDVIGDKYKYWLNDFEEAYKGYIFINAQTGTGKNYFIENVLIDFIFERLDYHCEELTSDDIINKIAGNDYYLSKLNSPNILIISNRKALKEQIKQRLLNKYHLDLNKENDFIFTDMRIGISYPVISLRSYQELYYLEKKSILEIDSFLGKYSYVVFDECHFLTSDASFNNNCEDILKIILKTFYFRRQVKIFMSSTICDVYNIINSEMRNNLVDRTSFIEVYNTHRDYSYLNTKYFHKIENLIRLIESQASSDEKWVIFVSSLKIAKKIKTKLKNIKSTIIHAGSNNEELENIINYKRFESKVLITTKVLDSGINLNDENIKNIVVMEIDRETFIQEIGRVRVDIENPYIINLYIPIRDLSYFKNIYDTFYTPKEKQLKEFENEKWFREKYRKKYKKLADDLFYLDKDYKWQVNQIGLYQFNKSRYIISYMIYILMDIDERNFHKYIPKYVEQDKFIFVKEQLSWIGLSHTFNEFNIIDSEHDTLINFKDTDKNFLELRDFIDKNLDVNLLKDKQDELIKLVSPYTNSKAKRYQIRTIQSIFEKLKLEYNISSNSNSKKKDSTSWKIVKKVTF